MNWNLVVVKGLHKGKVVPLKESPFLIGRDQKCHLRPADPSVSGRHCMLTIEGNRLILRDLKSTNGTFVNTRRVEAEVVLQDGDDLVVGPLDFKVKREDQKAMTKESAGSRAPTRAEPVDEETAAALLLDMQEESCSRSTDAEKEI